ncbi:calcyclin-binding [Brachionus plicatilis]|uniref:Calcyclin-binding protein n=1 Tax=Brachionus plicatilis TaxID=10195 RepID=A0A3M7SDG2_BRAPC|nr:calcyclin-binding [Brachionus plicatilis]
MSTVELRIKELQADLEEYKTLSGQATRPSVKQSIKTQTEKLEQELDKLQKSESERKSKLAASTNQTPGVYTKKIDTYGWDQSDKFVKIYITCLKDLNTIKDSDLETHFEQRAFDISIKNLKNLNYNLKIGNLLNSIDSAGSYAKLKTDMVTVFLKKKNIGENWSCLTEKEMISKEKSTPKIDENADPQEGLMSLMKKMYEEGDDEMKRTISKAFTESREKQMNGTDLELK